MKGLTRRQILAALCGTISVPIKSLASASYLAPFPSRGDSIEELLNIRHGTISLPFVMRGSRESLRVALTYDDGPTPGVTDRILDILRAENCRSTFFVIGQRVKAFPNLARRIVAEGHEIANHSYTHPDLAKLSDSSVRSELERTQKIIEDTCGVSPRYFRPPYGSFRVSQGAIAKSLRLQVIIWSVDPQDWKKPGASVITKRVTKSTSGGDIILCHDLHQQTAIASISFVPMIAGSFQLVQLSSLLQS